MNRVVHPNRMEEISRSFKEYQEISRDIEKYRGISKNDKEYQGISGNIKGYQGTKSIRDIKEYHEISIKYQVISMSLHNKPLSHIFAFQLIPIINTNVSLEFEKLKISFIRTCVERIS